MYGLLEEYYTSSDANSVVYLTPMTFSNATGIASVLFY